MYRNEIYLGQAQENKNDSINKEGELMKYFRVKKEMPFKYADNMVRKGVSPETDSFVILIFFQISGYAQTWKSHDQNENVK